MASGRSRRAFRSLVFVHEERFTPLPCIGMAADTFQFASSSPHAPIQMRRCSSPSSSGRRRRFVAILRSRSIGARAILSQQKDFRVQPEMARWRRKRGIFPGGTACGLGAGRRKRAAPAYAGAYSECPPAAPHPGLTDRIRADPERAHRPTVTIPLQIIQSGRVGAQNRG
jgi:hypothetical protein